MKINFESLRNIIRDRHNKNKNTSDSAVCLNEFLNLEVNRFAKLVFRRNFTSTKICISISDIFYADLGINYKPEFSYHHPVVILEKIGGMYLVVPVSTTPDNIKNAFHPTDNPDGNKMMRKVYGNDMGDKSDGFEKTGAILLSDIKVISAGRLISKKGKLKNINLQDSLFKEIKNTIFKLAFPKENIRLYKINNEFTSLQQKYTELEHNYNVLKQEHDTLQLEYNKLIEVD